METAADLNPGAEAEDVPLANRGPEAGRASPVRRSFARDDVANLIICILADYTERRSQGSRRGGCSARTPFTFQLRILCASVDEPIGGIRPLPIAGSTGRIFATDSSLVLETFTFVSLFSADFQSK